MSATDTSVSGLDCVSNPRDVRLDLHRFVTWIAGQRVQRTVRGNDLGKGDRQKLGRAMGLDAKWAHADAWISHLDGLAETLGFTSFDTKGTYKSFMSREPTYPDNFIRFDRERWSTFVQAEPHAQEQVLLAAALTACTNEFFEKARLGRLDRFSIWGSATGAMTTIAFPDARRRLLEVLAALPSGVWHETAELVERMKREHGHFLIPARPQERTARSDGRGKRVEGYKDCSRYGNFHEGERGRWGERDTVPDNAPDGFARVEGRWIERFLEGVPLELGYVEVAYGPVEGTRTPSRGVLRAFRVHDRLKRALQAGAVPPRVVVQPNFDVLVESPQYPWRILEGLQPMCDPVAVHDAMHTLRLRRERVVALRAASPDFDAAARLRELVTTPLPQNVTTELAEWTGSGDAFTVYEGFGLLECSEEAPEAIAFSVERVGPGVHVVRAPQKVYEALEKAARVPTRAKHEPDALRPLPPGTRTVFPLATPPQAKKRARPSTVLLQRTVAITLRFPDAALFEAVVEKLKGVKVEVLRATRAICYAEADGPLVDGALEAVAHERGVVFER